ncbi:5-formyltetrahydrofolate cyclo-ligase [Microbacterium capsulatum]|uniref:5-formyltetrahydrofolate cyclo-ligase n=1 Tax=Microbacterium capsulatum TaxID=3041921 RepID=A0ABU0XFC9_9MICO|nr:5-formyltetrahydrofolate cyclo-ligase [Microbacterium sp. ASV81]MDQ4213807.1 5-formyltetrahydrofolate cyclo-ligase [Microbacterium sp. ASV81]
MPAEIDHAKRALRADLRERRALLSDQQRAAAEAGITARLDELIAARGARSVSCFLSTTTEPGTRAFIRAAVARGIRVLLPITRADGLLDWAVADGDDEVNIGLHGLPEPTGEILNPMALDEVDLLIVPAAAVDRSGMRMGWGRGYFDRTLGSMQKCPPVYAVVFDSEILDEVPRDVHDQPVTGAVTPLRTVVFPLS